MEQNLNVPEVEVQYLGTTKFKYTLTQDNKVRIKIPDRFIGTVFEQDWINVCKEVTDVLSLQERTCTLRAQNSKGSKSNPKIDLRNSRKRRLFTYEVFNKKLIKIEKAEE